MSQNVSHSTTPIVLLIGLFDPTGQQDNPADSITCAYHGVHSVSAISGISVADSSSTLQLEPVGAELLNEQIRLLLEDTPVQAIKVGTLLSVEQISIVAQIAADYANVPLILHLGTEPPDEAIETEPEAFDQDVLAHATLELLGPQTEIAVIGANALERWLDEDLAELLDIDPTPQSILRLGTRWTLACGYRQRPGYQAYLLSGDQGEAISWPWKSSPQRTQDSSGLLACAIAANRALGMSVQAACEAACHYEARALAQAFQSGMGQRTARRLPGSAADETT